MRGTLQNRLSRTRHSSRRRTTKRLSQMETLEDRELFAVDLMPPTLPHLGTYHPELPPSPIAPMIESQIAPGPTTTVAPSPTVASSPEEEAAATVQEVLGTALGSTVDFLVDLWQQLNREQAYDHDQALYELNEASWEEMGERMADPSFYESFNQATRNEVGFSMLDPEPNDNPGLLQTVGEFVHQFGAVLDDSLPTGTVGVGFGVQVHIFKYHWNFQFDVHIGHDADAVEMHNTWTFGFGHTLQSGWDTGGLGAGFDRHITITDAPNVGTLTRPWFTVFGGFGMPDDFSLEYMHAPGLADPRFRPVEGIVIGVGPTEGWGFYADDNVHTDLLYTGDPPPVPTAEALSELPAMPMPPEPDLQ